MCGIAGFFDSGVRAPTVIPAMLDALGKRGPDARDWRGWDENFAATRDAPRHALLHTRLSIRDLSHAADQPMGSADGQIWLVYNGEVYGWEPWRAELEAAGYPFRTHSDTEFILNGYQHWGLEGLLPRLRGMFAIGLLDLRRHEVLVIRDRLGLKPVVYYPGPDGFAFASLTRAMLPWLPEGQRGFSAAAIDAYLVHRTIPAPLNVMAALRRLENGHYLRYRLDDGRLEKQAWWQPTADPGDWQGELQAAVELRMASDRPVGVFLSGGVDSTVIARQLQLAGHTGLTAFTARFAGSSLDESPIAADSARQLGLRHVIVDVPTDIDEDDFETIVGDLDDPFADPSSFPTWYLCREAVREVTVVLAGEGGDELFAGYKRYRKHLRSVWRQALRLPGDPFRGGRLLAESRMDWLTAYALRFSGLAPAERRALQPGAQLQPVYWRGMAAAAEQSDPLRRLLAVDMDNYLPEYVLRKSDLMSMAHGLEGRCPLLDHRFVQRVMGLPDESRFSEPPKAVLRSAADPVTQPFDEKKRGFNPPLGQWLGTSWRGRYLGLGARLREHTGGGFDAGAVDGLCADYLNGEHRLAERVLQLLILDTTLGQLRALGAQA